ncbi:MAG: hypothetical protein P0S96_06680 [Simkaniaceae bacterium]|nr:hypothetical protein [Candidatus Sacchlamyda saccharinae]
MDFPAIISFYTEGTPYEEEVQNLIASCKKYNLEAHIKAVPSQGSWELNCAYKPFFILEKLTKLRKPLLWVDADGVFMQKPTYQEVFALDLATRIEDVPDTHPSKVITSTLFVRPGAEDLLRQWIQNCNTMLLDPNRQVEFWDQEALRDVLLQNTTRAGALPISYAKIFDHPGDAAHPSVIEHHQASRRFKKNINIAKNS